MNTTNDENIAPELINSSGGGSSSSRSSRAGRPAGRSQNRGRGRRPGTVPRRKKLAPRKIHRKKSCVSPADEKELLSSSSNTNEFSSPFGKEEVGSQSQTLDLLANVSCSENASDISSPFGMVEVSIDSQTSTVEVSIDSQTSTVEVSTDSRTSEIADHNYAIPATFVNDSGNTGPASNQPAIATDEPPPSQAAIHPQLSEGPYLPHDLLLEVRDKVEFFLYARWKAVIFPNAIHIVLMSAQDNISVQRNLVFTATGLSRLYVHCQEVEIEPFLKKVPSFEPLTYDSVNQFVDAMVKIVEEVRKLEVCSGCDNEKFKSGWNTCTLGTIDKNPYMECRYVEAFRSFKCSLLVKRNAWRCTECTSVLKSVKRRAVFATIQEPPVCTPNINLTEEQKLKKLNEQKRKLDNANRKIKHMRDKMRSLIAKEGVAVDNDLSEDLTEILSCSSITPAQSVFLQEQVRASQGKKKQVRWHPTMLRLALSLHITSPAAYEMLRDTGMIKLPSRRTLFDYGRCKPTKEGVDEVTLSSIVSRAKNFKRRHQRYYVLMADEMHISQNLVFQKSTGRIIGYTNLDEVDREVQSLEQSFNELNDKEVDPPIAQKVLVYMVKGVSNGIKEVVATYAVANMSVNQMYFWTWEVICALEKCGIAVVVLVTDGCTVNRAFIQCHKPVTKLPNGLVFDTINKAAKNRVLYFMSDVPHLLKTIRNCLMSSTWKKKKATRRMQRNGKKISWDFITRLYEQKKHKSLRKSFKLNAMNVYPDSYAKTKVRYAGEVLSRTVAQDLEDQEWAEEAVETIAFIRYVNDWFDCLNGAHTEMGKRRRNTNLLPYVSADDSRFDFILSFVEYLDEWKHSAEQAKNPLNETVQSDLLEDSTATDIGENDAEEEEEEEDGEDDTPASKRTLSPQTLKGIEMSSRAFVGLVKFLLSEGVDFVNARIFTQDPLEQHFSKIRAGQGGSSNPNSDQVLNRTRALHTIGQLGVKRRKGNSGQSSGTVQVSVEPLPRRKATRNPRICSDFVIREDSALVPGN